MKKEDKSKILRNLSLITQIGISMIVPILIGIIFGNFLDNKLGTEVIFLIIFLILGVAASFLNLFKITDKLSKRK
ncbi:AtpZ/AtpI family protein [Dethiothermospora halolimnae]|uniref:AtpZ/AtpI family protein n=1 Tax=Dethiothermospora halolimnae TaxID=3114390 RepID=UPI003CCB86F9